MVVVIVVVYTCYDLGVIPKACFLKHVFLNSAQIPILTNQSIGGGCCKGPWWKQLLICLHLVGRY